MVGTQKSVTDKLEQFNENNSLSFKRSLSSDFDAPESCLPRYEIDIPPMCGSLFFLFNLARVRSRKILGKVKDKNEIFPSEYNQLNEIFVS